MKDRSVEFPNRYRLAKVAGTDDIFDLVPAPGDVAEEGTYINKATLLKDTTAALYGLDSESVPDEVLNVLSEAALAKIVSVPDKAAGVDWEATTLPSTGAWRAVAYGNGRFVAVSSDNNNIAAYSDDGVNWISITLPVSHASYDICFGDGRFVIVASNSGTALYSDDGVNWQTSNMPNTQNWMSVAYGNGRFVAVGNSGQYSAVSYDGISWSGVNLGSDRTLYKVVYGGGKFITKSSSTVDAYYSEDGLSWTNIKFGTTGLSWYALAYGNGTFVAMPYAGHAPFYSTDGIVWTASTNYIAVSWYDVVYADGKFVAVANNGQGISAYSEDGVSWVETKMPVGGVWTGIEYGDGKFVGICASTATAAVSQNTYLDQASIVNPLGNLVPIPADQIVGGVKIATGSYTGTGTYGASNPNSLTFDFEPKLLIVINLPNDGLINGRGFALIDVANLHGYSASIADANNPAGAVTTAGSSLGSIVVMVNETTVNFYSATAAAQMNYTNSSGYTGKYGYIAIG